MLKIIVTLNKQAVGFNEFHYVFHLVEHVFLESAWAISDNNFRWPDGYCPDFFKDEYEKTIETHGGLIKDLSEKGYFGIVSPEFMHTFYKNIWSDWLKIIALYPSQAKLVALSQIEELFDQKIEEIDVSLYPVVFQNIDGAFWLCRFEKKEFEEELFNLLSKYEGVEVERIEKT